MPKVAAYARQHLAGGNYNDSADGETALFGTPGSGSNVTGFYAHDIYVHMALCDDMSLWMAPGGGTVSAGTKIGSNRESWTPMLFAYPDRFYTWFAIGSASPTHYLGSSPDDSHGAVSASQVFSGCESSWSDGNRTGPVSYTMYDRGTAIVGQDVPSGYLRVNANILESGSDPVTRSAWTWLSGVVSYGAPDNTTLWTRSVKVQISATEILDRIFEYYPWERKIVGRWMSLNRDGSRSTTAGLFRRINGIWSPCTNDESGDMSRQHGLRRISRNWAKSPKSGEGA